MQFYNLKRGTPGKCFIYNCEKFKGKARDIDWSVDKKRIRAAFELLGYEVKDKLEIPNKPDILKDLKSCKYLVIFFSLF